MIKGINKNISPESAERGIGKVFALRFGHKNILKIQIFRQIGNISKLIKSRKLQKKILNKAKKYNIKHNDRHMMDIGSTFKCNKQRVDTEKYLTEKIRDIDAQISDIQAQSKKKNLGFAFISFKEKDCVVETLEEIELVKQNLMNDKKTIKLGIANWKVSNAYPPSDIIWGELQNIADKEDSFAGFTSPILNHSCNMLMLLIAVYLDTDAFRTVVPALLVS
jgi:hypothetical protein